MTFKQVVQFSFVHDMDNGDGFCMMRRIYDKYILAK